MSSGAQRTGVFLGLPVPFCRLKLTSGVSGHTLQGQPALDALLCSQGEGGWLCSAASQQASDLAQVTACTLHTAGEKTSEPQPISCLFTPKGQRLLALTRELHPRPGAAAQALYWRWGMPDDQMMAACLESCAAPQLVSSPHPAPLRCMPGPLFGARGSSGALHRLSHCVLWCAARTHTAGLWELPRLATKACLHHCSLSGLGLVD